VVSRKWLAKCHSGTFIACHSNLAKILVKQLDVGALFDTSVESKRKSLQLARVLDLWHMVR